MKSIGIQGASLTAQKFILRDPNLWMNKQQHGLIIKNITLKFLVCISPNGFIMHLSDCYRGRISDRYIYLDSNFDKFLQYGNEVLAE